jgi:ABC transport system ATP-binding/permease protein
MRTLRSIADRGRGVCLITHETGSLGLCDRVVVMAPGGSIAFDGSPEDAPHHFGVGELDAIYEQLEPASGADEVGSFEEGRLERAPLALDQPFGRQALILANRDRKLLFRASRTLALTLAQAPFIGLLIGLVLPTSVLSDPALAGFNGVLISFMLLIGAIFMGVNATARTIVGELSVLERETAAGVRTDSYIAAKALVAFPLIIIQTVLLFLVTVLLQPLNSPPQVYTQVLGLVILAGIAAAAMGLAVSARVRTTSQAAAAVPLLLIPQLLFAGAIVPVAVMPPVVNLIPNLMIARWGLAGIGQSLGLAEGVSGDVSSVAGFDPQFFVVPSGICVVILAGATVLALSIAAGGLNRKLVG